MENLKLPIALVMAMAAQLAGGVWWVMDLRADNQALRNENARLTGELITCEARVQNIIEDRESDNEIDLIPDGDLNTVPDHWLLPPNGSARN